MGSSPSLPELTGPPPSGVYVDVRAARNYARVGTKHFTVYELHLRYEQFTWVVTKRFSEICKFHAACQRKCSDFNIPRPPKTWRRHVTRAFIANRLNQLRRYFKVVLSRVDVWELPSTKLFVEVSTHSFDWKMGRKGKEGWLQKRSGGRINMANPVMTNWRRRWFMVKDACLVYFDAPTDDDPKGVVLVDDAFQVRALTDRTIQVSNRTRHLLLRTRSYRESCEWVDALRNHFAHNQRRVPHDFGSFAPVRHFSPAAWYVDGAASFAAMAKAMEEAQEQIFITGWWLSPDVQLIRRRAWQLQPDGVTHCGTDVSVRLIDLIWRKQSCGVKIYILLYKEVGMGLMANASKAAKARLLDLGHKKNIYVIRHPNHLSINSGALYWTHHDKVVVVDQKVAFLGGVDMCFGRYDNWKHTLVDHADDKQALWPGEDFYNPCAAEAVGTARLLARMNRKAYARGKHMAAAANANLTGLARAGQRMGDQIADAAAGAYARLGGGNGSVAPARSRVVSVSGPVVPIANTDPAGDSSSSDDGSGLASAPLTGPPPLPPPRVTAAPPVPPPRVPSASVQVPRGGGEESKGDVTRDARAATMPVAPNGTAPPGPGPARKPVRTTASGYVVTGSERLPDPVTHPRLPWHDMHMCVTGPAAVDLAVHFIQRWNHHRLTKGEGKQPWLIPRSDETGWWVSGATAGGQQRSAQRSVRINPAMQPALYEAIKKREAAGGDEASPSAAGAGEVGESKGAAAGGGGGMDGNAEPHDMPAAWQGSGAGAPPPDMPAEWANGGGAAAGSLPAEWQDAGAAGQVEVEPLKSAVTPSTFGSGTRASPPPPPQQANAGAGAGAGAGSVSRGAAPTVDVDGSQGDDTDMGVLDTPVACRAGVDAFGEAGEGGRGGGRDAGEAAVAVQSPADAPDFVKPWDTATKEALYSALSNSSCSFNECSVQILRSVSPWSCGVPVEQSVHTAVVQLIQTAKRFVYMENQYFISSTPDNGAKNGVVEALLGRIRRAIEGGERFRAIVVLPAHPEGDHHTNRSVQAVLHNQFTTISRGANSLLGKLSALYPHIDMSEYISFYSLRTEGRLASGLRVTEQVYVHSKLLIVDDCVAVIGSANVNDRSLLGDRDSEVMAVVVDKQVVPSRMGGDPWDARGFAVSLRHRLWRQHLGLMEPGAPEVDLTDPIAPETYFDVWMSTAVHNTTYYETTYKHVGQLTGLTRPPCPARTAAPGTAPSTNGSSRAAPAVQRSNTSGIGAYAVSAMNAAVADIARSASARRGSSRTPEPVVSTRRSYRRALLPEFSAPSLRSRGTSSSPSPLGGAASGSVDSAASADGGSDVGGSAGGSSHKAGVDQGGPWDRPRGLLVCFSFAFREGEDLRPDPFSPEGLTPSKVFQ